MGLWAPRLDASGPAWIRLKGPDFTILSHVSEKQTRIWAMDFAQFHQGLGKILRINEGALRPVTIVLFHSDRELRPFKPLEKGKPAEMAGWFSRFALGNFIGAAVDSEDEQTRRLIFHEEAHWLTNVSDQPIPLYLDEGLAEVFSTFSIDGDFYTFGEILPGHVELLRRNKWLPLKELIAVAHGSLLYNEGNRTNIFYAESWAFVHYLLFSGRHELSPKFNELVRSLNSHADPDAVFLKIFGVDCAHMEKRLEAYMGNEGVFSKIPLRFDRAGLDRGFVVDKPSVEDVDLAENCLLCGVGRASDALPRLDRIASALPGSASAWEADGFAAYETKDFQAAETCFKKAAGLGSRNYFVYSMLGDLALGLDLGSVGTQINVGGDIRAAITLYEHELSLNPFDRHAYDNIGQSAYGLDPLTRDDAQVLAQGGRLYPDDLSIRAGLAAAALKQGSVDEALRALRAIANDQAPSARNAVLTAKAILEDHQKRQAFDQLNGLLRSEDYQGAVDSADQLLKSSLEPGERSNLENIRVQALVAAKTKKAVDLANDGHPEAARRLLQEAATESVNSKATAQIQELLKEIQEGTPGN
jgi:tetratricopeptide (TPR) repeat protein